MAEDHWKAYPVKLAVPKGWLAVGAHDTELNRRYLFYFAATEDQAPIHIVTRRVSSGGVYRESGAEGFRLPASVILLAEQLASRKKTYVECPEGLTRFQMVERLREQMEGKGVP